MSLKFRNSQGVETPVAGLNGTSGELVPSVALQQSGTATIAMLSTSELTDLFTKTVTFDTPFDDTDYVLNVDQCEVSEAEINRVYDKTTTGFTVVVMYNRKLTKVPSYNVTARIPWQAFKLMTDEVHEADAAHIAQNTANFAPAFSEVTSYAVGDYVIYNNVLYRCTTAHTAGVWVAGHFTAVTVGGDLSDIMPSTPSNGLITITSISGANANATTTYTRVSVGDLVNVVIDSGVLFIPSWWGTVSGLSSLDITHIQNIPGISGECRILARVCKNIDNSLYLDFLRDTGVATINKTNELIGMRRVCLTNADSVIQIARTIYFQVPTSDIAKMEMKAIKSDGTLLWDGYVTATGAHGSMVITNTKWAGSSSAVTFNEWGTAIFANDEVASIFELTNLSTQ